MNTASDFDRLAKGWLAQGPTELSDRVFDAALIEIHMTRQRGRLIPWRFPMPALTRATSVATVVLVAVVGAGGLIYLRSAGSGGGTATPTPTQVPTAAATAAPTSAPPPSKEPVSFKSPLYGYTIQVPVGWTAGAAKAVWPAGTVNDFSHGEWFDVFIGDPGGNELGFVGIAAQRIANSSTPDDWMREYAQRLAASDSPCKGPVDGWHVKADVPTGAMHVRYVDVICDGRMPNGEDATGLRAEIALFAVQTSPTVYSVTGSPAGVDLLLAPFEAPATSPLP